MGGLCVVRWRWIRRFGRREEEEGGGFISGRCSMVDFDRDLPSL